MSVISPAPCGTSAAGTTMIVHMITCEDEPQRRSGPELMSSRHGRGPSGASTSRSQADESSGWENCAVKVPSVRIVDESAQTAVDEEKNGADAKNFGQKEEKFRS